MFNQYLTVFLGSNNIQNSELSIHYHLVNSEEKNRLKNNDKSIVGLEGKNLLYDNLKINHAFSSKLWKNNRDHSDFLRKLERKEKFSQQFEQKSFAKLDKTLGKYISIIYDSCNICEI